MMRSVRQRQSMPGKRRAKPSASDAKVSQACAYRDKGKGGKGPADQSNQPPAGCCPFPELLPAGAERNEQARSRAALPGAQPDERGPSASAPLKALPRLLPAPPAHRE